MKLDLCYSLISGPTCGPACSPRRRAPDYFGMHRACVLQHRNLLLSYFLLRITNQLTCVICTAQNDCICSPKCRSVNKLYQNAQFFGFASTELSMSHPNSRSAARRQARLWARILWNDAFTFWPLSRWQCVSGSSSDRRRWTATGTKFERFDSKRARLRLTVRLSLAIYHECLESIITFIIFQIFTKQYLVTNIVSGAQDKIIVRSLIRSFWLDPGLDFE